MDAFRVRPARPASLAVSEEIEGPYVPMSAIFQRPLCQMGAAYDYAFRPILGDPEPGSGGPCDERPHRVDLIGAGAEPSPTSAGWRSYDLCPEHEAQLRREDARLRKRGPPSRFRTPNPKAPV